MVWLMAAGLMLVLGLLGAWLLQLNPARFFGPEWLLNEHGNELYRAQILGSGGLPYRDFECQYGPLPLYAYAAFAKVFGNTIRSCAAFHLCVSLLVVGALFMWLARAARKVRDLLLLAGALGLSSLCLTVFFLNPLILSLGANFEYLSFERLWLVGLAAGWRPPAERSARDAARLAFFLLLWQLTKFGGGAFGVAAFFGTDLIYLAAAGQRADRSRWLGFWITATFACIAAEAIRAGLFYAVLPKELAARSLWPLWVLGDYPYDRLHLWVEWRHFAVFIAPIAVPAAVGMAWTAALLSPRLRLRQLKLMPAALWFPAVVTLVFYLGGSVNKVGYFGREWLFFQYAWALTPALLLLLLRVPLIAGVPLVVAAYGASAGMFLRSVSWRNMAEPPVRTDTAIGAIWDRAADPGLKAWFAAHAWLDSRPGARFLVFSDWSGGGWYAARRVNAPVRNAMFVHGIRTAADNLQFGSQLRDVQLLVFAVPGLSGNAPAFERLASLKPYLLRRLPEDLTKRVLEEYEVLESDPHVDGWLLLRRRDTK